MLTITTYCLIIGFLPAFLMALLLGKIRSGPVLLWCVLCISAFVLGCILACVGQNIANSLGYHTLLENILASVVCAFIGCFFPVGIAWIVLRVTKTVDLWDLVCSVISFVWYMGGGFLIVSALAGQLVYLCLSSFPPSDSVQISTAKGFMPSDVVGTDLFGRFQFRNDTNQMLVLCLVHDSQDTDCDSHAQGWYQSRLFLWLTGPLGGEVVLRPHQQVTVVFDRSTTIYHIVVKNDVLARLTIVYSQQSSDPPDDDD